MFKGAPSAEQAGCSENQAQDLVVRAAEQQRWLNERPPLVTEAKIPGPDWGPSIRDILVAVLYHLEP